MTTLKQLCAKYYKDGWPDKDSIHSYIEVYEEILAPYRKTAKNILEIGLFTGASLRMWEEYFIGNVFGIDSSETPLGLADLRPMLAEGTHNIFIMDATDEKDVNKRVGDLKFDVIIDDAAHNIEQQIELYRIWKHHLSDGGIYIIEDIQDIYVTREQLENIDSQKNVKIIDRRLLKERYDDCLCIIK